MSSNYKLLAALEPRGEKQVLAAFVSAMAAPGRVPAMQLCDSPEEGRQWVEREAAALRLPVEWVSAIGG